ncbi:MAG: type I phosphomannose isomerase catalytic subunit [Bacillota bacterium]
MYPLKFVPIYKRKIWGGRNLEDVFARDLPVGHIGESWEISDHGDDKSRIANGKYKGKTLQEIITVEGEDILGTEVPEDFYEKFPLLIKIIDATEKLSVQVHPDDEYAQIYEDGQNGKTEMWYILRARPGAKIVYGLKNNVNRVQFKEAIAKGTVGSCLNYVEVEAGDSFYIPAGTVHAIGSGIMIAEIQQNSDITYRVYDWDRSDDKNRKRELHISSALDVIDFRSKYDLNQSVNIIEKKGCVINELVRSPHFNTDFIKIRESYQLTPGQHKFHILMNIEGRPIINYGKKQVEIHPGETLLIPAQLNKYNILGKAKIIKTYL